MYTYTCTLRKNFIIFPSVWSISFLYLPVQSLPTIETCATRAIGPNGEIKMSKPTGPTNECQYQSDFYGNFKPVRQYINIFASYIVETSSFPPKPSYIDSNTFGITHLTVLSVVKKIGGKNTFIYNPMKNRYLRQ